MTAETLKGLAGREVTAKRAGWSERLTAGQEFDAEPYAEKGYASDDLRGELTVIPFATPGGAERIACLVGGQEADPATVRPAD